MKAAMLLAATVLTISAGVLLIACASSHPRHTQAKPEELGEELHSLYATNVAGGASLLRVAVCRFQGTNGGFWGKENQTPTVIVGSISLQVGGVTVPIPATAFRDLAEVQYPAQVGFLDEHSASFFIRGGDGGFAYTARFEVRDNHLRRRTVTLDESNFRETSRY